MNKPHIFNFEEFLNEAGEPVGLAILGAPAGGKSRTMRKIAELTDDARIKRTLVDGVSLTVDKLRDEFLSKNPRVQLKGFVKAFYLMRSKAAQNDNEFGKWFSDIQKLWKDKFAALMPELNITVERQKLLFNGKSALEHIKDIDKVDAAEVIGQLDNYQDYKRVVRYFQDVKQEKAIQKRMDVSYDEAGDEPSKIVNNVNKLHKQGYVTDVFLIHPENIATNIIQNFYRVVKGDDGGRDSSAAIVQAFKDIESKEHIYRDNAEDVIKVDAEDITPASEPLKKANVEDDDNKGDKPIDVLVQVKPMSPEKAYKTFINELPSDKREVFIALLRYAANTIPEIPVSAKNSLDRLTKNYSNEEVIEILQDAAESKKYVFKFGGVTPELVTKAKNALK
jgi:hypothetical protein